MVDCIVYMLLVLFTFQMADGNLSIAELRLRANEAVRLRRLATERTARKTHQRIVQRREQLAELEARVEEREMMEKDCYTSS